MILRERDVGRVEELELRFRRGLDLLVEHDLNALAIPDLVRAGGDTARLCDRNIADRVRRPGVDRANTPPSHRVEELDERDARAASRADRDAYDLLVFRWRDANDRIARRSDARQ